MTDEVAAADNQLESLDALIGRLEQLVTKADEVPLAITSQDPPRRAAYRFIGNVAASLERKPSTADAVILTPEKLVLKCQKTEAVRLMNLEATIRGGKNGRGEVSFVITGSVAGVKRVRGGYEIEISITETRRVQVTPGQKIRESVESGDAGGWNRWCQDIRDAIDLAGINLANANLSGYDLCCADLTDADLSGADLTNAILAGADLSRAKLEAAKVAGADFFRSSIRRDQVKMIALSGMPEKESVIYVD